MRVVNIGELKNQLSGYLQAVRAGEEIIVRDRNVPVARIVPFKQEPGWEEDAQLVASGAMKMPTRTVDWQRFFAHPSGDVPVEIAVQAVVDSRGDR